MTKEKFALRSAVYLVLFKDGEVLLSRRFKTGYHDGEYSMIAGHLDGDETVARAMARETKEEADMDIAESDLRIAHTMHRICIDNLEYIDFFLTAKKWAGEPRIMEPNKCDDISWHPLEKLPDNILPYIRFAIEKVRKGVTFSDYNEKL